jgi:hypothetical protein
MSDDGVLRRMFGPQTEEVTSGCIKEFIIKSVINVCSSPNITRAIKCKEGGIGRAWSTHGIRHKVYKMLVGKAEQKRFLGRSRRRWKKGKAIPATGREGP